MNIYEVSIDEAKINDIDHYILATDFPDAFAQAQKLLKQAQDKDLQNSAWMEIVSITKKFTLEVVK